MQVGPECPLLVQLPGESLTEGLQAQSRAEATPAQRLTSSLLQVPYGTRPGEGGKKAPELLTFQSVLSHVGCWLSSCQE